MWKSQKKYFFIKINEFLWPSERNLTLRKSSDAKDGKILQGASVKAGTPFYKLGTLKCNQIPLPGMNTKVTSIKGFPRFARRSFLDFCNEAVNSVVLSVAFPSRDRRLNPEADILTLTLMVKAVWEHFYLFAMWGLSGKQTQVTVRHALCDTAYT